MDVMMNMTTEDVRVLREHFTGRMNLEQFVGMLKKTLHDRIHSELDFVVGVVDLFNTIDVNGDKYLDWDEFAGYMMDAGQAKADFYFDDLQLRTKQYAPVTFPHRDDKTPLQNVRTCIQQLLHLLPQHALAYFERDSDVVYLYALEFDKNDAPRHVATMRLHTAFQEHTVICIAYVPTTHLLIVSSMLHVAYVSAWNIADLHSPSMVHRVESLVPHEHLCYVPALQCLLSAAVVFPAIATTKAKSRGYRPHTALDVTRVNQLVRWDIVTNNSNSSSNSNNSRMLVATELTQTERFKGVRSVVTSKSINRTHVIVGCEDGVITIVDVESFVTVSAFDAHSNGVQMLAFSPVAECLASIGCHSYADETTLHVCIWRKRSSSSSSSSHSSAATNHRFEIDATLKHHDAPLERIAFVDSRRQLLSLDASGVFFVYSSALRTPTAEPWEVLQRFTVVATPPHRSLSMSIQTCVVVPETAASDAVLITAGRTVAFYDLCDVKAREEVFYCHYCETLNLLVGVTATTLLFWFADSGKLWKTFAYAAILAAATSPLDAGAANASVAAAGQSAELLHNRTITAACVDDRERKLIVGDDTGSIKIVNVVNGNIMKELDPHTQAVVSVAYVLRGKRVVSIASDARLHIYDENNALGFYVPFGAMHPQSVLLQSLRFCPAAMPVPIASAPALAPESVQLQRRRRTHRRSTTFAIDDSALQIALNNNSNAQAERFEILKSVGNAALDRIAVLVVGSRGESFIQVWSFDMRHAQGTCVLPQHRHGDGDDEITCVSFFGASSADLLGGTASGRVYFWRAIRDDPGYHCAMELLQCASIRLKDVRSELPCKSTIQHMFAVAAVAAPLETVPQTAAAAAKQTDSQQQYTQLDADTDGDASTTFSLTNVHLQQQQEQQEQQDENQDVAPPTASHASDRRGGGGMHVFAADDRGIVTTWFVRHATSNSQQGQQQHLHHYHTFAAGIDKAASPETTTTTHDTNAAPLPPTATAVAGASNNHNASTMLQQHEEIVLGYDTVAALYTKAITHERLNAAATRQASVLPTLAPTHRWVAHDDNSPVLCLSYALDPCVVLTSSARGEIKIWRFDGSPLGVLDDFASRRQPVTQPWRFPLDMTERRRRKERDAQQFLEKARGFYRRNKQHRVSVLQQRLSLSHDELTFHHSPEKLKTRERHRASRLAIRPSDIGRAIRSVLLAQAAPAKSPTKSPLRATPTSAAQGSNDSLQVVLKEIDQLQLQSSARSGSASATARRDPAGYSATNGTGSLAQRAKKHYACVTLADIKPFVARQRPRSSTSAVHCTLPQLSTDTTLRDSNNSRSTSNNSKRALVMTKPPLLAGLRRSVKQSNEVVVTRASLRHGALLVDNSHLTLDDLRDEAHARPQPSITSSSSNQDAGRGSDKPQPHRRASQAANASTTDPVLKYHVKLAHSWQQYSVR